MPLPGERPRVHRLTDIEPQACKARADESLSSISTSGNMGSGVARFPKLDECAHFHYEHVELDGLEVSITDVPNDGLYAVRVTSGDTCWSLQRSYENFVMFDKQLHRCIYDRKFSSLANLSETQSGASNELISLYLERFSQLNHEGLNCGPVLNWLQLDNRGRRILVPEADSCPINTPAVAAAYAVRPYSAQAQDEISFQVGDMISVIDMPPPGESTWWRGKKGFAVGFFPAECVAVIGDKVPRHLTVSTTIRCKLPVKPVLRKHGKLIAFFRSFILNRPSRRRLKQSGILKERVFGCDLGEHLLNSGHDVPVVLTCCAEFIEAYGLVDGIYRLSGITSNIQRLRNAFDEDRVPALQSDESILQDIHSVASLLKMYFRELPNPLCTYQLYSTFVNAVQATMTDSERLRKMREAVRKLPPPHYRTLEYLMRHLVRVAARGGETGMTPRNVAIVWAPNLLRCKELEVGGVAALQGVGVQAVVTEFLVCYAELIFSEGPVVSRPKSLAITTTPGRLLSLEEARNRNARNDSEYIEVGAGSAGLPLQYHTVIDLPRKRNNSKRSPSLNWRAIFGRANRPKTVRQTQVQSDETPASGSSGNTIRRLRPVKSADSLDGEDGLCPLMIPTSSNRACGHSRSVSHDSYFDHLAAGTGPPTTTTDPPSSSSPLDLSEIQLNFDLEEREMRMFSEEEQSGGISVEASPRHRHRNDLPPSIAVTGGSKRKRSRLEERLHCDDVELRFIDSQSPDQVMVSADIHGMDETPSPLITPGYLPLLSEPSTPLSPNTQTTLQPTPVSISPGASNCSRISFRSFTLSLDPTDEPSTSKASDRLHYSQLSVNPSQSMIVHNNDALAIKDTNHVDYDDSQSLSNLRDREMSCDTLDSIPENSNSTLNSISDRRGSSVLGLVDINDNDDDDDHHDHDHDDKLKIKKFIGEEINEYHDKKQFDKTKLNEEEMGEQKTPMNLKTNEIVPFNNIDFDYSPMSCEQIINDSGYVIYHGNEAADCKHNNPDNCEKWIMTDTGESATPPLAAVSSDIMASESLPRAYLASDIAEIGTPCMESDRALVPPGVDEQLQDCISKNSDSDSDERNGNALSLDDENVYCDNLNNDLLQQSQSDSNIENNAVIHMPESNQSHSYFHQSSNINEDEVIVPSEHAAEACQMVHQEPEGAASQVALSINSSCTFTNNDTPSPIEESVVLRDTAAILQELALQRLSGQGVVSHKSKNEFGEKQQEENEIVQCSKPLATTSEQNHHQQQQQQQHLPPCLRARHARASRAALSRSLDEAKFNKMTSESAKIKPPDYHNHQHNSSPNVGSDLTLSSSSQSHEKLHYKNLGLDLGDPRCRERIEKYKEERRMFLRDKYRSESFRGSASRDDNNEQALLTRLKQRASRPSLLH